MNGSQQQTAPVSVGETNDVSIDAVGEKGDGIARIRGFVLFVPNVKKGDYVKIKVTKVLAKVGFAEVVEKLEHAPPPQQSRFATVSREELRRRDEPEQKFEETEDFGEGTEEK